MYAKVSEKDVPKRGRKSESKFEATPEWAAMRADLKGLRPKEALQIGWTEEDKEKYGITNRRTIARFIQKYLDEHKLKYQVKSFNRNAIDYVVVRHQD